MICFGNMLVLKLLQPKYLNSLHYNSILKLFCKMLKLNVQKEHESWRLIYLNNKYKTCFDILYCISETWRHMITIYQKVKIQKKLWSLITRSSKSRIFIKDVFITELLYNRHSFLNHISYMCISKHLKTKVAMWLNILQWTLSKYFLARFLFK